MKLSRKYLWNILLIVVVTAVAMYFALKDNFVQAMEAIGRMNGFMLLLVVCWGLLYNAIWGVSYQVLGAKYKKGYSLMQGVIVALVGTFFAGITPSSTGGQFGQAYVLKKQGISLSDGASLLWADFIIYQTTMMIYVTILFIVRFTHYLNMSAWFWIVFVGYLVNLVVICTLYTIALFPRAYIRISVWAAKLLGKLSFIKNPQQMVENWTHQMTSFTVEIKQLSKDKKVIVQCMVVSFMRLSLYFALPFVIANALGVHLGLDKLVDVLALSSFVTMANSFIPLPGASGGTEVVFTLLFGSMLKTLTGAVLLLWRISSYYVPVVVGALTFLIFKNHHDSLKGEKKAEDDKSAQIEQTAVKPDLSDKTQAEPKKN